MKGVNKQTHLNSSILDKFVVELLQYQNSSEQKIKHQHFFIELSCMLKTM